MHFMRRKRERDPSARTHTYSYPLQRFILNLNIFGLSCTEPMAMHFPKHWTRRKMVSILRLFRTAVRIPMTLLRRCVKKNSFWLILFAALLSWRSMDVALAPADLVSFNMKEPAHAHPKDFHPRIVHLQEEKGDMKQATVWRSPSLQTTLLPPEESISDEESSDAPPPQHDEDCTYEDWQLTYRPTCNEFHQVDMAGVLVAERLVHLGKGAWRAAWNYNSVAFKTYNMGREFAQFAIQRQINDAMASEHAMFSSRIVSILGFCGVSEWNELASGGTLSDRLVDMGIPKTSTNSSKWRATWKTRVQYAHEAARALADLHLSADRHPRILHSDLSPANFVLVGTNGTLKLNDFNRAKLLGRRDDGRPCGFFRKYHNAHFSAPEEATQQELTPAVEIYALGCVLFSLLTGGNYPFQDIPEPNATQQLVQLGHTTIPQFILESQDPAVHQLLALILQCWTYNPSERPTAFQVAQTLQTIANRVVG